MAAGLPTTSNFGNPPYPTPVSEGELRRNTLFTIGDTATGASITDKGFYDALQLNLFNAIANAGFGAGSTGATNAIAAPYSRYMINNAAQANQNATLQVVGVYLPQNFPVNNFNFLVGTTGDASPANQYMCLLNSARVCVAASADGLTTAIVASTTTTPVTQTYAVANIASGAATQYVTPTAGLYYIGLAVKGSSTLLTSGFTAILQGINVVPILAGNSTTTTTVPLTNFTTAQTAITGIAAVPYMWLS